MEDDSGALFQSFREAVAGLLDNQTGLVTTSVGSTNQSTMSVVRSVRRTLDDILSPPQLQRNKSGKIPKKSTSLTMAFSSEEHREYLKKKDEHAKAEEERKRQNKINREQMKENKLREKREKQEQWKAAQEKKKAEAEKKKAEKRKLMEERQLARLLRDQEKKKRKFLESDSEEESIDMVLEKDGETADEVVLNVNTCIACGDEDGDVN